MRVELQSLYVAIAALTAVAGADARPAPEPAPATSSERTLDLRESLRLHEESRWFDLAGEELVPGRLRAWQGGADLELAAAKRQAFAGRLAFTVDADFAELGLSDGRVPISDYASLERRDSFLGDSAFGFGAGGPTPFNAGSVAGAPILAGVKLSGREGPWRFAAMSLQLDEREQVGRKHLSVGRLSLDLANGSNIGLIATAGDPDRRGDNYVVGTDFSFRSNRVVEDRVVEGSFWVQQSMTTGESDEDPSDTALGARISYPNDRVRWEIGFSQVGESFDAALGTVGRRGVREYTGNWRYRIQPGGWLRSIETSVDGAMVTDLAGEIGQQRVTVKPLALEMATADRVTLQYTYNRELLASSRPLRENVVLAAGEYEYERYEVGLATSPARPVQVGIKVAGGGWYSGTRLERGVGANVRLAPGVDLAVEYRQDEVELDEAGFETEVVSGRVNMALAPGTAITNAVHYDRLSEAMSVSSQLRWRLQDGNELNLAFTQTIAGGGLGGLDPAEGDMAAQLRWTSKF